MVINDRTFQMSHAFLMYRLVAPGNSLVKGPGETLASPLFILFFTVINKIKINTAMNLALD